MYQEDDPLKRARELRKSLKEAVPDLKDVFVEYGYGVVAFFTLLSSLIIIFFGISLLLSLPQILAFMYLPVGFIP